MIKSWVAGFKRPSRETRYGDSQVFIDTKNNICFIVDGGDGECASRLISYLKENNIKKVYLLLTHPHSDHGDGLRKIIKDSYFTVLCFYCYDPNSLKKGLSNNRGSNSVREDIDYLNRMISEAKDRGVEVKYLSHGDKVELGNIKFNVYREQPSRVEDDDTYGWAYVNDGSLCLYFPDLYYWTSGDGSDRIWDFIKKLGLTVKFFKIPHHGNNCPQSQANGLKSHGANLCWYNDLEPNGIGTTDFTAYGARRCKEAGIKVIDCIGSDINMTFAMGKATITKGSSSWNYTIPYNGGYLEGWVIDSNGWWYRYKDGSWAVGWKKLKWSKGEHWFYFNEHGYMVTGWQYLKWSKGWSWFYFDKTDGYMKTSWVYDDNNWYYLNPTNGYMQTGWLDYNGRKCYLEPVSGKNQGHAYRSVTVKIDGETWQFDDNCYGTKITNTTAFTKRTVIDISQFNNITNWSAVKATGYPVIIRIGYRGSKTGAITYDPKYKEYRSACEKYGIEHGFYFFPCSITDAEAHEEALFIKNEVIKSGIAMPVYLDSEVVQRDKSGRSDNLSKEKRTRMLRIICEDLIKWGIPCGIYASRSWLYNNLDMANIPNNTVKNTWVAEYGVEMTKYTGTYIMWQYTSKGSVNGISGNVDLSYQYNPFYLVVNGKDTSNGISQNPINKIEKSELEKVIEVAKAELGYLEKQNKYRNNDEILYHKTKGAGSDNVVKYWKETKPEWQGSYWCFTKGTMVLTDKGYKPIEDIKIGDKVLNANGDSFNTVIETKSHEEDVYKMRVYGTLPFNVTGSHPFLSAKRLDKRKKEYSELSFRPMEELNINDVISSPHIKIEKETQLNYDALWSLGFYVGDGWKTNKGEFRICGGVDKEPLIEQHFKNITKEKVYKSRTCQEYRIRKQDNELFISYLEECGTGAMNKKVPHSILFGSKKDKRAFLDGYLAADGTKNKYIWTISKELVLGIAKICMDLGYGISVREVHREPFGKIWDKRKNAYRTFAQQEMIYTASINVNSKPQHQLFVGDDEKMLLPIKQIENYENERIVYNISTDGDHTYLANNLAVHNCADFITWVFQTALGKDRAKQLLKHYPYTYCPTMANLFTLNGTPKVGDIVIFKKNGVYAHTGLVIAVSGNTFTTIEGNTSGASTVVDNGGGVCQKTYNLRDVNAKFCRPAYSSTTITSDSNKVVVSDDIHTVKWKGYVNIGRNTKLAVRLQPNTSAKECSFSGLKQGTEVGVSYEQGDWYLIKYDGKFGYVQKQYIGKTKISEVSNPDPVTDNIHTVKWNGIVNTNGGTLNVRLQPTTSAKTCSFSPLRKGTEIGVCHQSGNWYLIKYNGKYGYVYSSYIKRK